MGFSIERFLEELEYKVSHGIDHLSLLAWIAEQKAYAKECGVLL